MGWSLKDILDVFPNFLLNCSQQLAAVNDLDPLRFTLGEIEITLPDALVKLQRLAFHAVEQFPAAGTLEADARVEVDHQRQVRHAVAHGEAVNERDAVGGKLAAHALVDGGGIEKAVGDDDLAFGEGRLD